MVLQLLKKIEFIIVPVANPDGYHVSHGIVFTCKSLKQQPSDVHKFSITFYASSETVIAMLKEHYPSLKKDVLGIVSFTVQPSWESAHAMYETALCMSMQLTWREYPKYRLWRKNTAPTINPLCDGVDLNRNFDAHWSLV